MDLLCLRGLVQTLLEVSKLCSKLFSLFLGRPPILSGLLVAFFVFLFLFLFLILFLHKGESQRDESQTRKMKSRRRKMKSRRKSRWTGADDEDSKDHHHDRHHDHDQGHDQGHVRS